MYMQLVFVQEKHIICEKIYTGIFNFCLSTFENSISKLAKRKKNTLNSNLKCNLKARILSKTKNRNVILGTPGEICEGA